MLKYYSMLCTVGTKSWFPPENDYLFTYPKSRHWINGCSVIRKYALMSEATHPELLTSCRLRKHIATVTQLLSLKENEVDQLAKFMGHTKKTHETYYKLPQDVYQIAKVSKNAAQFKNKSLEDIDIGMDEIELNEFNNTQLDELSNTTFSDDDDLRTDEAKEGPVTLNSAIDTAFRKKVQDKNGRLNKIIL